MLEFDLAHVVGIWIHPLGLPVYLSVNLRRALERRVRLDWHFPVFGHFQSLSRLIEPRGPCSDQDQAESDTLTYSSGSDTNRIAASTISFDPEIERGSSGSFEMHDTEFGCAPYCMEQYRKFLVTERLATV